MKDPTIYVGKNNIEMLRLTFYKSLMVLICLVLLLITIAANADSGSELIAAAKDGDLLRVNELLDKGADVNAMSKEGYTALSFASTEGHTEIAKALLDKGAKSYQIFRPEDL